MKRFIACLFFTVYTYSVPPIFSTLSEIQHYAKQMDEYPPIDNTTWANPDYSTFLRRKVPSYWDELLYTIGVRSWPLWNVQGFDDLLKKLVKDRENNGYIGRFVLKMKPLIGSSFIIWGDIQGAFHSLVRVLEKLRDDGIINENLEIIRPYIYFIFNGDLVNRSAYTMEALTVVMRLMERNPDKVFYIRGNHEDRDHWRNFNLKRDLIIRAATLSDDEVPLGHDVSRFFDTLPLSLYLIGQEDDESINVVRISHYGRSRAELEEEKFSGFFQAPNSQKATVFKLSNKIEEGNKKVNVRAIVRGESRSTVYRPTLGLSQLEADKGATAWTLLSSPIESYRYLQDFYFDAFAVLDVGKTLNDWTITLYNQDVRELLGFKRASIHSLITGLREFKAEKRSIDVDPFVMLQKQLKKVDQELQGLTKGCPAAAEAMASGKKKVLLSSKGTIPSTLNGQKRIVFGSTLALSGSIKEIGQYVEAGLKLVIDEVNEVGGIDGRQLQLVVLDDAYNPKKALENIGILHNQYNTGNILNPTGTPTLQAYLDLVEAEDALVLFPTTGSMLFRQPKLTHIVNLRASDNDTGRAVAQHMVDTLDVKKIAIVYQDDDYGKGGLQGVKQVLQAKGVTDWKELSYEPNMSDFASPVEQIKAYNPKGIIFISSPLMAKNIIKQFNVNFFTEKHLGGTSDMGEEGFQDFIKEKGLRFIVGNILPDVHTSSLPIVKEFREKAQKKNVKIGMFSLEAFIDAKLLVHVLRDIKEEVTQKRIIEQIESIKDLDFGGLKLSFDPQTRQLLHSIWLNTGTGDFKEIELEPLLPEKTLDGKGGSLHDSAVRAKEILFGTTLDLSKGVVVIGRAMRDTIDKTIHQLNAQGGIKGKRLQVIFLDDEYEPELARNNIKRFLEVSKTNYILSPAGSATTESYLNLIKNGTLLVLFPISGAEFLRDPALKNLLNFRVSYLQEMKGLTEYIVKMNKPKRLAVFYQNDSFGLSCLEGIKQALHGDNNVQIEEVPYKRNDVNFVGQIKKLRAFDPDAIAFCSTSIAAKGLIRQLDVSSLRDKKLWGVSDLGEDVFQNYIKERGLTFYVANILPDPNTSDIEIAKDFRALAKKSGITIDIFAFEAYVSTLLAAFLIDQVEDEINKEKILAVAEGLKNIDFKGLTLNFNPLTRELSNSLWISTGDNSPWTALSITSSGSELLKSTQKKDASSAGIYVAKQEDLNVQKPTKERAK